jgi:hypothetical protein
MVAFAGLKTLQIIQQMLPGAVQVGAGSVSPTASDLISGGARSLPAHYDTVA